jgi:molybdopterin synthase sulfur carrier subunit
MIPAMPRPVTLLYFAAIREAVGATEEPLSLPDSVATIADLSAWLQENRPPLRGRLASVRFAVNEAFVEPHASVASGDVIALIPPVSGG